MTLTALLEVTNPKSEIHLPLALTATIYTFFFYRLIIRLHTSIFITKVLIDSSCQLFNRPRELTRSAYLAQGRRCSNACWSCIQSILAPDISQAAISILGA